MNVIFTICSVNYLASAKTLWQSVLKHNPDTKFVCVLADKLNNRISLDFFEGIEIIEVEKLKIENLDELIHQYNITEFNTAIKPFAIDYLHKKYNSNYFIYFDPDIIVFKKLDFIWENLRTNDFIVTPHLLAPILNNEFYGHQVGALNTGIFNLGFIALNYNHTSKKIIEWWKHHMVNHGHSNSLIGEFYDQKIMNLLPIFSDKVLILKNPGCNVAGWNMHERNISKKNNTYLVNDEELVFYHYSGFVNDKTKGLISKYNHLKISSKLFIGEILDLYRTSLELNGNQKLKNQKCFYNLKPDIHRASRFKVFTHKLSKLFK